MPFYIRKSVRVGPFRFNLSKSGIGVSAGVRGLRIGMGPRGNYVHLGRGGLYYRQTLSSRAVSTEDEHESYAVTTTSSTPPTHGPMRAIASGCITQMCDSSSAVLLGELERKRNRMRLWPIAVGLSATSVILLVGLAASPWVTIPVAAGLVAGTFLVYQRDILAKSVVMLYDLDDEAAVAYRRLYEAAAALGRCGATWHVSAQGNVYDPKYHAGAGQLVNRKQIHVAEHAPPFVRTNISIMRLPLGPRSLYFLPDRILAYAPNGVGAIGYADLCFELDSTRFIEDGNVPGDATIVDRTWRYVNKSGGPDRRFSDNRELPVCLYEKIRLHTSSGLNEVLQVSQTGLGSALAEAVRTMASSIAAACVAHDQRQPKAEGVAAQSEPTSDELYETLFNVLCCLMVADGRASRSEKARIAELMRSVQAPWGQESVETRLAQFIEQVQTSGYNRVVSETLARIPRFKKVARTDVLVKCMDMLADADGIRSPREQALYERVRELLA